jgi:hypothetical protein
MYVEKFIFYFAVIFWKPKEKKTPMDSSSYHARKMWNSDNNIINHNHNNEYSHQQQLQNNDQNISSTTNLNSSNNNNYYNNRKQSAAFIAAPTNITASSHRNHNKRALSSRNSVARRSFAGCFKSLRVSLTAFFLTIFVVCWITPIGVILKHTKTTVDKCALQLGAQISDSISATLEGQFKSGESLGASMANFTHNYGIPT